MADAKNYFRNFLQDSTQENVLIIPHVLLAPTVPYNDFSEFFPPWVGFIAYKVLG